MKLDGTILLQYVLTRFMCCMIGNGANEVDMLINIDAFKGESYGLMLNEILFVTQEDHAGGAGVKVIIETTLRTRREKILACLLTQTAGTDFVKTSAGFGSSGAKIEDVDQMSRVVEPGTGVKVAGGIRTCKDALVMISAGANRIGSSAGGSILNESLRASQ